MMRMHPRRIPQQRSVGHFAPVFAVGTVEQPYATYTAADHLTWRLLYRRQREKLVERACPQFLSALERLDMTSDRIPRFADVNKALSAATGWTVVGVEGLLSDLDFFHHMANRRLPVTWWIRHPDQLRYSIDPDLFHGLFGHAPLLIEPDFADYLHAFACLGLRMHASDPAALDGLARLNWYTVEYGLIHTAEGLRIYGAGLLSSWDESRYALESTAPNRIGFAPQRIMHTRYRIHTFQQTYFVIDSFEQLMDATLEFGSLRGALHDTPLIESGTVRGDDRVLQRGTRRGWVAADEI